MTEVRAEDFAAFFEAVHGHQPYPWQRRLAAMAVRGDWPDVVDLPTGAGKTACIDVAVFALACQARRSSSERSAPCRVFFCVNRRVIVDEAYDRSLRLARCLLDAERSGDPSSVLARVAAALRVVAGGAGAADGPPLDVLELRGGVHRDNRWARSVMQPQVICTTVDQLGSRLLFRGYGVSPLAAPIQAALVAWDSLVLLDEAHISRPFLQTLAAARRYVDPRVWAEDGLELPPMRLVPMTATPPDGSAGTGQVFGLDDQDRATAALGRRLRARKPTRLVMARRGRIDAQIVEEVLELVGDAPVAVAVLVNRVQRAREVHRALAEHPRLRRRHPDAVVELVIGAMRPCDRDLQAARLASLVGPARREHTERTCIVVATQCLEVGADYDFDVMVTECASLDALRQRFGRLNRAGRPVQARGVVVVDPAQVKRNEDLREDKPLDPIYGNAIARTWNWLSARAGCDEEAVVDFGIDAMADVSLADPGVCELLAPSARLDAPTLLPSHLDLWVQTAPRPQPDPDVSLFLHGPDCDTADVMVCWRADLDPDDSSDWAQTVALLPPTAVECMTVGLSRMRRWLAGDLEGDAGSDLLGEPEQEPRREASAGDERRRALVWRGREEAGVLKDPADLRPGDTLVLPAVGGWNELGHVPERYEPCWDAIDVAESAFRRARARPVLRLHPVFRGRWTDVPAWMGLLEAACDPDGSFGLEDWRHGLSDLRDQLSEEDPRRRSVEELLATGLAVDRYPDGRGVVLTGRRRIPNVWYLPELDEGDDASSRIDHPVPVPLDEHLEHVHGVLLELVDRLPLAKWREALEAGVLLHDIGKADERFQALLSGQDRTAAWLQVAAQAGMRPLAKSDALPLSPRERALARRRAELPRGFRHEMLSLQMAERAAEGPLPAEIWARDLALHLIASHHGHARPFAPVALDDRPADVRLELQVAGRSITACLDADWRARHPAHRADAGVADRFWRLVRRHGWWGLAFLEAVVRLADQMASARESAGVYAAAGENR